MTVHGAKGLEAPIVILADTMTQPAGPKPPRLLPSPGGAVVWAGRKADDVPPVAAARQTAVERAADEYRRLLYVAMTRAADRLIVCGARRPNKRPDGCWYNLVRGALEPLLVEERRRRGESLALSQDRGRRAAEPVATSASGTRKPHGRTAGMAARAGAAPSRRVADAAVAVLGVRRGDWPRLPTRRHRRPTGRRRSSAGGIVHRLMQALPDIPAAATPGGRRALSRGAARNFSPAERDEMARQVLAILDDPRICRAIHAGQPRRSADRRPHRPRRRSPMRVSGQVDRLVVTADAVLIADYKTDRSVPRQAR